LAVLAEGSAPVLRVVHCRPKELRAGRLLLPRRDLRDNLAVKAAAKDAGVVVVKGALGDPEEWKCRSA
jgi:hypothetical protein